MVVCLSNRIKETYSVVMRFANKWVAFKHSLAFSARVRPSHYKLTPFFPFLVTLLLHSCSNQNTDFVQEYKWDYNN